MTTSAEVESRIDLLIQQGREVEASQYPEHSLWKVRIEPFNVWRVRCLDYLKRLLNPESEYVPGFKEATKYGGNGPYLSMVVTGIGLLEVLKQDVNSGYMQSYRQLVEADLLGGLMGQAEHLLEMGYLVAAAAVAGAGLQQHLEELAKRHGLKVQNRETLDSLADKLLQANVLDGIVRRQLSLFAGVRNAADHGQTDELTKENVDSMVRGAVDFLAKHAT